MTHIYTGTDAHDVPILAADRNITAFGRQWQASKISSFSHDALYVNAVTCGNDVTTAATVAIASALSMAYARSVKYATDSLIKRIASDCPGTTLDDLRLITVSQGDSMLLSYTYEQRPHVNMIRVYDTNNELLKSYLEAYTAGDCTTFVHIHDTANDIAVVLCASRRASGAIVPNLLLASAITFDKAAHRYSGLVVNGDDWHDDASMTQHSIATQLVSDFGDPLLHNAVRSDSSAMHLSPSERDRELDYGGAQTLSGVYDVISCGSSYLMNNAGTYTCSGREFSKLRIKREF